MLSARHSEARLIPDPYKPSSGTPLVWYGQAIEDSTTDSGQKSGRMWLKQNRREEPERYCRLLATELFELLDADGDGELDLAEWKALLAKVRPMYQAAFIDLFYTLDGAGDKNGKVSLKEWMNAFDQQALATMTLHEFEHQNLSLQ
eukprot:3634545-Prymnesium_polylepis.1